MKKIFVLLFIIPAFAFAQSTNYSNAKAAMMKGDFETALALLTVVTKQEPGNISALQDEMYIYYLQRNFKEAKAVGEKLISLPNADFQAYKLLGLTYKALAEEKQAVKLYEKALDKFPNNAVIYAEYGDLLNSQKKEKQAVEMWEKGIRAEPNYSTNYFYASNYYFSKQDWLKAALLGELFVNLESRSNNTLAIKQVIADSYKQILAQKQTAGTGFYPAVLRGLRQQNQYASLNPEVLTQIRTSFIVDWFGDKASQTYPFYLFAFQKQLVREGLFEAYNQWLFDISGTDYENWSKTHEKAAEAFNTYQRSRMFKTPKTELY
jgi:tetratricopeptide (TPR) repeat protein